MVLNGIHEGLFDAVEDDRHKGFAWRLNESVFGVRLPHLRYASHT